MKRKKLFRKIFEKHLNANKEPIDKFVDDVGPLKGMFSYKGIDVKTGKVISQHTHQNLLVNQSKSAIIRLLGQGSSRYLTEAINPENYRIARMRFSNDLGSASSESFSNRVLSANKYDYYSLTENSHRVSYVDDNLPGGTYNTSSNYLMTDRTAYPTEISTEKISRNSDNLTTDTSGNKIVAFKSVFVESGGSHPVKAPSHGSVVAKFYKDSNLIEEVYFDYKIGETAGAVGAIKKYYNKNQSTNKPHRVVNYPVGGVYYLVTCPMGSGVVATIDSEGARTTQIVEGGVNDTSTKIYYDYYSSDSIGWKAYLAEPDVADSYYETAGTSAGVTLENATGTGWDYVEVTHTTGLYNTANLIIPKSGVNNGYGTSSLERYASEQDYYTITTPTEDNYEDSDYDLIDDYAVTFSVLMNSQDGNGQATEDDREINYKKAYLHCLNDDLFSSILIPSSDFKKKSGIAYVVNWRILAPVD